MLNIGAGGRIWIALVASLVLALQSAASLAATVGSPMALDAFGNPLCITSGDHHAGPTHGDGRGGHHLSDCCKAGCGGPAPFLPPAARLHEPPSQTTGRVAAKSGSPAVARIRTSGGPRAPPLG